MMLFDPRVRGTVAAVEKKLVHAFSHLAVISAAYNLSSAAGPAHERSRRPSARHETGERASSHERVHEPVVMCNTCALERR